MRILVVTTDYVPNVSGIATLSYEQAEGLAELGHEVMVLTTTRGSANRAKSRAEVCRIDVNLPPVVRLMALLRAVHRTARSFGPDFIWCTNYRGFGLPVMLTAQRQAIPYGIFFHGTELITENRSSLRHRILKTVARRAAVLCTNSRNSADLMRQHYGLAASVATPGVHAPAGAGQEREPAGYREHWLNATAGASREDLTVFIAACRISRQKGIHTVLQAIAALDAADREKLIFVAVGAGPDIEEFKALRNELHLEQQVHFHGPASQAEIPAILKSADVYLQPSQPEGDFLESFGISFLEAQMAGLPCIATRWGGIPEAVQEGETAILVPPGSIQAVTDAIRSVLRNPGWRQSASDKARKWALANSWKNHAINLESHILATKPATSHD